MPKQPTITPGPWEYDPSEKHYSKPIVRNNGMVICHVLPLSFHSHGDRNANGHLIAAAPDLLKALKDLCRNVDADLSGFWTESTSNFMQQAEAAISKAEGRVI